MDWLTALFAVTATLVRYALEQRSAWAVEIFLSEGASLQSSIQG
jgi:hypothetical protein